VSTHQQALITALAIAENACTPAVAAAHGMATRMKEAAAACHTAVESDMQGEAAAIAREAELLGRRVNGLKTRVAAARSTAAQVSRSGGAGGGVADPHRRGRAA
jgi:hypothetical protein